MHEHGTMTRRAPAPAVASADPENLTVEAIASTGAPVDRLGVRPDGSWGAWREELDLAGADLGRLVGAPLLRDHQNSTDSQVGVVDAARREPGRIVVSLRFAAAARALFDDVAAGIRRAVSVGYSVRRYEPVKSTDRERPVYRAVDWQPLEVSLVPVGADGAATFRNLQGIRHMTTAETAGQAPADQTRTDPEAAIAAAILAERTRAAEIRRRTAAVGLPMQVADALVERGVAIDHVGDALIDELAARGAPPVRTVARATVGTDHADPARLVERRAAALAHRAAPSLVPLRDDAREFAGLGLVDHASELLNERGVSTRGLSRAGVVDMVLRQHATSDFPALVGASLNSVLLAAFQVAQPGLVNVCRRGTVPDFKDAERIRLGEFPTLEKVTENGEIKRGSIGEQREKFRVASYGKIFDISREAIVNDSLAAFATIPQTAALAAADLLGRLLSDTLKGGAGVGPTMSDGKALFHADHGNLAGAGTTIDVTNLGAGRAALRKQVGIDKTTILGLAPRFIVVGPDRETLAEQIVAQITAAQPSAVNPFSGRLEVVVDPRLVGNAWYLFADPALAPVLEWAELDGSRQMAGTGPMIEQRVGFDVDGLQVRARYDVGAGAVDFRGAWRNPGA